MIARLIPAAVVCVMISAVASAQTGDMLTGKVASAETKGKTTKLTVATEAGDQTFELTPKVELEIVSTGDDACLAKGLLVRVDSVESNKYYFGSTFSVYPEFEGKTPPAAPVKAPMEIGQSKNRYFITGEIVQFEAKPEEKYDALELKGTGKAVVPIYVERQRAIRVVQTDPSHIEAGQSVTLTGKKAGAKFLPSKVSINTGATIKGDELVVKKKK